MTSADYRTVALDAWGVDAPAWILALADEASRKGQKIAGQRIGRSASAVSQVLRKLYPGDLKKMEAAVSGALLATTVRCPVLDEIGTDLCQFHQSAPKNTRSSARMQMYAACRSGCPHSRLKQEV